MTEFAHNRDGMIYAHLHFKKLNEAVERAVGEVLAKYTATDIRKDVLKQLLEREMYSDMEESFDPCFSDADMDEGREWANERDKAIAERMTIERKAHLCMGEPL